MIQWGTVNKGIPEVKSMECPFSLDEVPIWQVLVNLI